MQYSFTSQAYFERPSPRWQYFSPTKFRLYFGKRQPHGFGMITPQSSQLLQAKTSLRFRSRCTLYVCTSCRVVGTPREPKEEREGFILYQKLREAFAESRFKDQVNVRSAACLSICSRPCGIALSSPGAWSYLFGDQRFHVTGEEIVACVSLYLQSKNGYLDRALRPKSLQKGILGRIPPREEVDHAPG